MVREILENGVAGGREPVSASVADERALQVMAEVFRKAEQATGSPEGHLFIGMDGLKADLPEPVVMLLRQIVPRLLRGEGLMLVPVHQQLTTQEAADLLNVSRPFLIRLLDQDEIPYMKTGTHRRIRLHDLLSYKRRRDATRRQALDRLAALSQEYGLDRYDD